eukprot:ANDGO_02363.mRNA.1 Transmembrane emp24 domain-containing protein eca
MLRYFQACVLLGLLSAAVLTNGTFIQLQEGSHRCLSEDTVQFSLLRVVYSATVASSVDAHSQSEFQKIGIKVDIKNPMREKVFEGISGPTGEVKYTTKVAGDHLICFSTNTSHWWPSQNIVLNLDFDIRTGNEAVDMKSVARKEHVEAIQSAIARLERRVSDINTEYTYQKFREFRFRHTSEETNSRVAWWSVAQLIAVVGVGVAQVFYIRRFFAKKGVK